MVRINNSDFFRYLRMAHMIVNCGAEARQNGGMEAYVLTRFFGNFFPGKKIHEQTVTLNGNTQSLAMVAMNN